MQVWQVNSYPSNPLNFISGRICLDFMKSGALLLMMMLFAVSAATVGMSASDALALKSEGTPVPKYGSATKGIVCGDMLCSQIEGGSEAWEADPGSAATVPAAPAAEPEPPAGTDAAREAPHMPPETSMTRLADNVYHFFGGFYGSLVVLGERDVLITDPANDIRAHMLKEEIAKMTDVPVTKIVLTHEHYDHVGGTLVFADADVICQQSCQAMFELDPFGRAPQTVDVTFDDLLTVDIGDISVELHHFGPGDGEATTVIYLPEEQILATADLYGPHELTDGRWMDDVSYGGVHAILDEIKDWPVRHSISGHSPDTDPSYLHDHAGFVDDLYNAVYDELAAAMSGGGIYAVIEVMDTLPGSLTLEKYADWDGYEKHFPVHIEVMISSLFHGS